MKLNVPLNMHKSLRNFIKAMKHYNEIQTKTAVGLHTEKV